MRPGFVVYLKSGGPALTIKSVLRSKVADVTWLDGSETPRSAEFPLVCLTKTDPKGWSRKSV